MSFWGGRIFGGFGWLRRRPRRHEEQPESVPHELPGSRLPPDQEQAAAEKLKADEAGEEQESSG